MLKYTLVKMAVVVSALVWTCKTSFAGVAVHKIELTPHHHSRASFLALVNLE